MTLTKPRPSSSGGVARRWRAALFAFLALVVVPLGVSGCAGNPFAPAPTVADVPEQAFKDGEAREEAARKAAEAGMTSEAGRLWNETATYYGAVANKFTGSENGLRALLEQAEATEKGAKNNLGAQSILKSALKQYNINSPLRDQAKAQYDALIQKMDQENSKTFYYQMMDSLVKMFGNDPKVSPVLAIFAIAVAVTIIVWPFRAKQYRSAKEMQRYEPELRKIREKYKNDQQTQMLKTQEFFKEHGINQFAGCLPMLLQMPVTLLMYQVILHYQFHFSQSTFLWMNPQNAEASVGYPFPFQHGIAQNLGEPDLFLLLVYAASMFLQTKLMPMSPTADPAQVEQQKIMAVMMPAMFFVMMLQWQPASAFVLYWFISNILGLIQQAIIYKMLPTPEPFVPKSETGSGNSGTLAPQGAAGGGAAAAAVKPLAANPKLVSPKSRRKKN